MTLFDPIDLQGLDHEPVADVRPPSWPTVAPGKSTLTSRLFPSFAAMHARGAAPPTDHGARPVQRRAAEAMDDPFGLHLVAARGVAGPAAPLPHLEAVQRSFGHHDLGQVRAHVGGGAAEAAGAIGAHAYATGDDVAFAATPDLHTTAHEAAHVVQQRGGVRLAGGVGRAGDPYEQHADAVAELVVRGESAEALLDTMAHRGAAGGQAVQGRPIQLLVRQQDLSAVGTYQRLVAEATPAEAAALGAALSQSLERVAAMQERVSVTFQHRGESYQLQIPIVDARRLHREAVGDPVGDEVDRRGARLEGLDEALAPADAERVRAIVQQYYMAPVADAMEGARVSDQLAAALGRLRGGLPPTTAEVLRRTADNLRQGIEEALVTHNADSPTSVGPASDGLTPIRPRPDLMAGLGDLRTSPFGALFYLSAKAQGRPEAQCRQRAALGASIEAIIGSGVSVQQGRQAGRAASDDRAPTVVGVEGTDAPGMATPVAH